jgi:hypothetical protein
VTTEPGALFLSNVYAANALVMFVLAFVMEFVTLGVGCQIPEYLCS